MKIRAKIRRHHGVVAMALLLSSVTAAHAFEHVTLRNGFELDCVRRELDGDKVRLYLAPKPGQAASDNYLELPANSVLRVETMPDPPAPAPLTLPVSAKAEPTGMELGEMLSRSGAAHNIDADLLASVVHAESGGRAHAVSRTGARGLMQLMPGTALALGVKDSFAPAQNVEGGTTYLDQLLTRYHDNIALALAAYNAGPGAVDRYRGVPPFRETRAYVSRIIREFNRRKLTLLAFEQDRQMKRALPWLVLALVVGFIAWKLHGSHFDWAGCARSFRTADLRLLLLAAVVISSNNLIRAIRWAVFLRPALRAANLKPVPWTALVGSQFIGFAGLAIFGRLAELIRPLLISRRTGLPFTSQVAVVAVERVFDLASFGLIFALNLLLSPALRGLPYLSRAGYTIATLTVVLIAFVFVVRLAGDRVARIAGSLAGRVSQNAGSSVAEKILSFRNGLSVVSGAADFALICVLSVVLWLTIAAAYYLVLQSFPAPVSLLSLGQTIVMMGFSVAGSALPIPSGSGAWAGNSFALDKLLGIPTELAVSAGLMVWLITTWAVVPLGLIFAKLEGVSIGAVAKRSEDPELPTA